jgi:mono/diheme cytochrome c family protein
VTRKLLTAAIFIAVALLGVVFWRFGLPAMKNLLLTGEILRPGDTELVERGGRIYQANCGSCHGVNLEGQPDWRGPGADGMMPAPPHDETGHTWHHTDDVLFGLTKYGVAKFAGLKDYQSAMPVYENILTDDEIIAALSFIKAQWPEELQKRHSEMNTQVAPGGRN